MATLLPLVRFRVQNFKCVEDSGWIDVDPDVTAFVGKNESGKSAILEALRDFDRLTSNTRFPGIADDTSAGAELRATLGDRLRAANKKAWEPVGIHLGYRYDTSPIVVPDGTQAPQDDEMEYVPTARPGSRAPHVWLDEGRSTLDLFGRNFTLLCLGENGNGPAEFLAAAKGAHVPLDVVQLTDPKVLEAYERRLVLVRSDGHVAWRGDQLDIDPRSLIDTVRGA